MEKLHLSTGKMKTSPISSLLKAVMQECALKQVDLADVLQVSLDRVKSLTSGKVQKLTPDETRRLVQTLNLSGHWLATGEGPMFDVSGGKKMGEVLTEIRLTAARIEALDLSKNESAAVSLIANGLNHGDAATVRHGLALAALAGLPADEQSLMNSYRQCTQAAKHTLITTAALLAAGLAPQSSGPAPAPPPAPSPDSAPASTPKTHNVTIGDMHNATPGGVQVGYAGGKVKVTRSRN